MGGHKHTNVADADSDTEYAVWGQVRYRLIPDVEGVSANYTVLTTDAGKIIRADATSAAIEITLPNLGASDEGFQVEIRKSDSTANVVTVSPDGADTINGGASRELDSQYEAVMLLWTGAEWLTQGGGEQRTPEGIADALETLTGTARLSFNALSDTPTSVGTFDLYGDVTAETATPAGGDRFVMADVSVSGEPNRYLTFTNLKVSYRL